MSAEREYPMSPHQDPNFVAPMSRMGGLLTITPPHYDVDFMTHYASLHPTMA